MLQIMLLIGHPCKDNFSFLYNNYQLQTSLSKDHKPKLITLIIAAGFFRVMEWSLHHYIITSENENKFLVLKGLH